MNDCYDDLDFSFSAVPGEITRACITWTSPDSVFPTDYDPLAIYDALEDAFPTGPADSLFGRLGAVASRYGGRLCIIDDFALISEQGSAPADDTAGWNDNVLYFAFPTAPDEVITAYIQWYPPAPLPDCGQHTIYDALRAAFSAGPAESLIDRLEDVASQYGGEFGFLDELVFIGKQ